jgi:bacteriorhodopsin
MLVWLHLGIWISSSRGNALVSLKGKASIVDVTTFCILQLCAKLVLVGFPLFLGIHPLVTTLGSYDP